MIYIVVAGAGDDSGLIEIIGTSAVGAVVLQWHTKLRYISDLPVSYVYATLVIDKKAFGKLSAADQAVMREVMEQIYRDFDEMNLRDDEQATEALAKTGIETIHVDQSQVPQWRELVNRVNKEQADKGVVDPQLYQTVQQHLEDFRAQQRSAEVTP